MRRSSASVAPCARRRRASVFCASVNFGDRAHVLPALLRPAAALSGAGADKVAFYVRQPAEHRNHQPSGAGAGIGPRLGQRAELRPRMGVNVGDIIIEDGDIFGGGVNSTSRLDALADPDLTSSREAPTPGDIISEYRGNFVAIAP
jgi:class 3 adenylate cyclase